MLITFEINQYIVVLRFEMLLIKYGNVNIKINVLINLANEDFSTYLLNPRTTFRCGVVRI